MSGGRLFFLCLLIVPGVYSNTTEMSPSISRTDENKSVTSKTDEILSSSSATTTPPPVTDTTQSGLSTESSTSEEDGIHSLSSAFSQETTTIITSVDETTVSRIPTSTAEYSTSEGEPASPCIPRIKGENPIPRKARIAFLLPFEPETRLFSLKHVRPAMDIALKRVVSLELLSDLQVEVSYRDSKCSISDGMNEAVNFYATETADVFFGPTCDYAAAPVARQVRYWNKALVTAGAMAGDFGLSKRGMFPLLTRVGANFNSLLEFLRALLAHYNWRRLKLIYNPDGFAEVMDRYCHIAMDAVHHGLRIARALGIGDVIHDYYKFDKTRHAIEDIPIELGGDFS
ncbi:hypothetical protein BaRGS_00034587, partial [Batillaria attramentaria]